MNVFFSGRDSKHRRNNPANTDNNPSKHCHEPCNIAKHCQSSLAQINHDSKTANKPNRHIEEESSCADNNDPDATTRTSSDDTNRVEEFCA